MDDPNITDIEDVLEGNSSKEHVKNAEKRFLCSICNKSFAKKFCLKRHVLKIHPEQNRFEKPCPEEKNYKYTCNKCKKNFSKNFHFLAHMRTKHGEGISKSSITEKCFFCKQMHEKKELLVHLVQEHSYKLTPEIFSLSNFEEFLKWKKEIQNSTKSKFALREGCKIRGGNKIFTYICHRSGNFVSHGNGIRHLKTQGSNKCGYFCPAKISVTVFPSGACSVKFIKQHVGHVNDLDHLSLTEDERRLLGEKIALKVPFKEILNEIRDSFSEASLQRLHLVTNKDLHNIEKKFNLNSEGMRHAEDHISVSAWVNEMESDTDNCILFYKEQGTLCLKYPDLKKEDFLLIIMNNIQCDMLLNHSADIICVDSTHGLNSYNFELVTVLILDELRHGFPCAFCITNRTDALVMSIFFASIKIKTGILTPKVFMSDMAEAFYNGWMKEMGEPQMKLFCNWHVDKAWRTNLPRIKCKEKQIEVYKILQTLLQETDETAFNIMLQSAIEKLCSDEDTVNYAAYFKENYTKNVKSWAYCHRINSGLNTNSHIESMHRAIKYIYLNGKQTRRLDKSIHALMSFVKDKVFDRIITFEEGKISNKIKNIRERHKTSLALEMEVINVEGGWVLPSEKNIETSNIQKEFAECPNNCSLICSQCKVCIHMFSCTCIDYSIKWNMCKHIHYVVTKFNLEESPSNDLQVMDMTSEELYSQLKKNKDDEDLVSLKQRLEESRHKINTIIDSISTEEEYKILQKFLSPIETTLAVHRKNGPVNTVKDTKLVAVKNIQPQLRFFSTKKKRKITKSIMKPTAEETQTIACKLILKE